MYNLIIAIDKMSTEEVPVPRFVQSRYTAASQYCGLGRGSVSVRSCRPMPVNPTLRTYTIHVKATSQHNNPAATITTTFVVLLNWSQAVSQSKNMWTAALQYHTQICYNSLPGLHGPITGSPNMFEGTKVFLQAKYPY